MRLADTVLLLCVAVFVSVGCNVAEDPDTAPPDAGVGSPADLEAPSVPQESSPGGDDSEVEPVALTEAQLRSIDLHGELACAFAHAELGTLLVARADVLPDGAVHGVLSNNGFTEMLANLDAGGFDDLLDGITLEGRGMTVLLERGAPEPTGDESTRHVATLTVQGADGAGRNYAGTLTCGP